ncbi:MAG: hypothetical protein ACPGVX_08040, partial [Thalassobaculaceae bacterium]
MRVSTFTQNTRIETNIQNLQRDLATAQRQISTGKKTDVFSGLNGVDARLLMDYRAEVSRRDEYVNAINSSDMRMRAIDAAMNSMQDVLSDFRADLLEQSGSVDESAGPLRRTIAEKAFTRVVDLLNTSIDGRYLFNGYDTGTAPMQDADTVLGSFATAFGTPEGTGVPAVIAAADDTYGGGASVGFFNYQLNYLTATQTAGETFDVRISDTARIEYGNLASEMGDLLDVFAVFANYDYTEANAGEYQDLLDWGRVQVESGLDQLNVLIGELGAQRQTIERQRLEHENFSTILQGQIIDLEQVDQAEA